MTHAEILATLAAPEQRVTTRAELDAVLSGIDLAPCAKLLADPRFSVEDLPDGRGWLVWLTFQRPDRETGLTGIGRSRKELVERGTTESGTVKTAWLLLEITVRHELMEGFLYRGVRIFDPHHTVDDLSAPSRLRATDALAKVMRFVPTDIPSEYFEPFPEITSIQFQVGPDVGPGVEWRAPEGGVAGESFQGMLLPPEMLTGRPSAEHTRYPDGSLRKREAP